MTPRSVDPLAAVRDIPRELLPAALALIAARLAEPSTAIAPVQSGDGMLSPADAAQRLGVGRRWIWDHADRLGAVRLSKTMMRIPAASVERELQARGSRKLSLSTTSGGS